MFENSIFGWTEPLVDMMWSCYSISVSYWTDKMPVESFRPAFKKNFGLLWQKLNGSDASLLDWNKLWQGDLQKQPLFCVFGPFTMYLDIILCVISHLKFLCEIGSHFIWECDLMVLKIHFMQKKENHVWVHAQRPFLLRSFLFPLSILSINFPCLSLSFTKSLFIYTHCLFIFHFLGRKIAIDASMSIYQFLIAVRSDGSQLTNEAGEITRLKHQYKLHKLKKQNLWAAVYGFNF